MTPADMKALRKAAKLTQAEMAAEMGISHRQYQDIETGAQPLRKIHGLAAERVSLSLAARCCDPFLATAEIRKESQQLWNDFLDELERVRQRFAQPIA